MRNGTTTIRDRRTAAAARRGFTLAEVLIAIGIMAAGLTMAAAMFPAGIRENGRSSKNIIGTIIATNGLAVVQAYYGSGTFSASRSLAGSLQVVCDNSTNVGYFPLACQAYPTADPWSSTRTYGLGDTASSGSTVYRCISAPCLNQSTTLTTYWRVGASSGFAAMGRQVLGITGNANTAQIISIAYQKSGTNTVTLRSFTATAVDSSTYTPPSFNPPPANFPTNFNLTGAVVVSNNGEVARVTTHDPSVPRINLDHPLNTAATSFWVAVETGVTISPGVAAAENRISLPVP